MRGRITDPNVPLRILGFCYDAVRSARHPVRRDAEDGLTSGTLAWVWLSIVGSTLLATRTVSAREDRVPLMTAIDAIRALTPEAAERGRRVAIRGTITYINEREPAGLIVHDGASGLFVHYGRTFILKQPRLELHPGDVVEIDGHTTGEGFAPAVVPDAIRKIGRSALPPARRVPYAALLERHLRLRVHRDDRRRSARVAVRVRQDAVRGRRGRRRPCPRLVLGFLAAGSHAVHRCPRQASRQRRHAVQPGAAGARRHALRRPRGGRHHRHERSRPWSLAVRAISSLYTHHAMDQVDRRVSLAERSPARGWGSRRSSKTPRCIRDRGKRGTGSTSATTPARR